MAIIIPSKSIYEKNHDISPDNALSSIFLTENVVKFIEEKPNLKTTKIDDFSSFVVQNPVDSGNISVLAPETILDDTVITFSGYNYVNQRFQSSVDLERISEEYYITKVAPTVQINFNIKLFKNRTPFEHYADSGVSSFSWQKDDSKVDTYEKQYDYVSNSFVQDLNFSINGNLGLSVGIPYASISISEEFKIAFSNRSFSNTAEKIENSFEVPIASLVELAQVTQTKEQFTFNFAIPSKLIIEVASVGIPSSMLSSTFGILADSYILVLTPQSIDITWNETERKLNNKSEEITIKSQEDNNHKYSFQVSANTFMNTVEGFKSETEKLYSQTLNDNLEGKEIVTLRCSVNDYYDENGEKAISITDPSKMLFRIGQKVIPMSFDNYGRDVPLSTNDEGMAKVFNILGCRLVYDGSVTQELSLRESSNTFIKTKLPSPIISIENKTLTILDASGLAESYLIYVNLKLREQINTNSYDLTQLGLKEGEYLIYVVAIAENYYNSDKSNMITYFETIPKITTPTISLEGDILTITDESGLAEEFDIIVDGEVKATVEAVVEPDNPEEPDTQTLTVVNTNNTAETASFTMPIGYTFEQFIGSEYDTSGGKLSTDAVNVWYDNNILYYDSELNYILFIDTSTPNLPNRTYYYAGESVTYQLSGTWVFNEVLQARPISSSLQFTSNGGKFRAMSDAEDENLMALFYISEGGLAIQVYYDENTWGSKGWRDKSAYRTITFEGEQTVSKEFYDWFKDNANRQTFRFGIEDGGVVQNQTAEEGMTWAEWVESEYNASGFMKISTASVPDGVGLDPKKAIKIDAFVRQNDMIISDQIYTLGNATIHSGGNLD